MIRRFRRSVVGQALVICFVATHLPLIALVFFVAFGSAQAASPWMLVAIALVATLVGTGLSLAALYYLIKPLDWILKVIDDYRSRAALTALKLDREDEVGRLALAVHGLIVDLNKSVTTLHRQANSDPLTGLGNRRWLMEVGAAEVANSTLSRSPLSALVFDLDHFKSINDGFGHSTGDSVLTAVGDVARAQMRPMDLVARIGGEEFCVLLPGLSEGEAAQIGERLRRAIHGMTIGSLPPGMVSASVGVASTSGELDLRALLDLADRKLYRAKDLGRNMVVSSLAAS
ncbi:MAG TPA: diguanylate cyclase [Xanthobacteraceae bacterium]|nr:diguanylate cyclase [Xanthobacteraceae bacterium]